MISPQALMRIAIESCEQGIAEGQSPFGCAIAFGDRLLSQAHNTVVQTTDITAHAEINALRAANLAAADVHLTGAIAATTCEPCPMCMAALHWARVDTVYFGATIADAQREGFNELRLSARDLLRIGGSDVALVGDTLADECRELFAQWRRNENRTVY